MRTYFIYFLLLLANAALAQNRQHKARISAQYIKVMNRETFIAFSTKYKGENGFEPASGLAIQVYKKMPDDSLFCLGTATTNSEGKTKFVLNDSSLTKTKEASVFTYVVKIENQSTYEDSETEINVSDANLSAAVEAVDSINQIRATLTDGLGQPLASQSLKVQLQRMYAPLPIGEESYETDENGSIIVPIDSPMPGINGELTFEVVLNESETYGTVKALVTAPIGTPIVDQSTFDERTLWSPPSKAPYYLLIFPNLIIIGVWLPILLLIINLFRISKAKINL
ncbi:MAG: hypothetical protein K2U26_18680 [Cyclobacteriaceae bacterium]|nr:hypothetical protein [Cyclobacteriaceae bacterium]